MAVAPDRGTRRAAIHTGAWPLAALLALLLASCGTGPSERDTEKVVDRFQAAIAASEGRAACAQLTEDLRGTLESDEGKPCVSAVLGLGLRGGGRAVRSRVYITSALVDVAGGGAAFLDQTRTGWRISAAGCVRSAGAAKYDCRLKD